MWPTQCWDILPRLIFLFLQVVWISCTCQRSKQVLLLGLKKVTVLAFPCGWGLSTSPARRPGARVASPCLCLTGVSLSSFPVLAQLLVGPLLPLAPAEHLATHPVVYRTKLDHPPTLEVPGTPKTPDNSLEVTRLENSLSSHEQSTQNLVSTPDITVSGIPTHVSFQLFDK